MHVCYVLFNKYSILSPFKRVIYLGRFDCTPLHYVLHSAICVHQPVAGHSSRSHRRIVFHRKSARKPVAKLNTEMRQRERVISAADCSVFVAN